MSSILPIKTADFEVEVIQFSHQVPVLVDFWAPWCGPCRAVAPVLERLAAKHGTKLSVRKVNVDEEPELAYRYGIQGIPDVKVFRSGRIVAEQSGAAPEAQYDAMVRPHLPSEASDKVASAQAHFDGGAFDLARRDVDAALEVDARNGRALLLSAQLFVQAGALPAAEDALSRIPYGSPEDKEAESLRALVKLGRTAGELLPEAAALERVAADPADGEAQLALGIRHALSQRHEAAMEALLDVVKRRGPHRKAAQEALVAIFALLGPEDELVRRFRPRLAALLY
jgi:putative thioredoxin